MRLANVTAAMGGYRSRTLRLPGEPRDVGIARYALRRLLAECGIDGEGEASMLVLSELVTNAVVHGAGPIDVLVKVSRGAVEMRVADTAKGPPVPRHAGDDDEHGRGLHLVAALSAEWRSTPTPQGKVVIARVPLT